MLKQRVITATSLMALFLIVLFVSSWQVFVGFVALAFLLGAWEWSDLSGYTRLWQRSVLLFVYSLSAFLLVQLSQWATNLSLLRDLLLVSCVWWAVALLWVQGFPSSRLLWHHRLMRATMGLLTLVPAWLAVVYLRNSTAGALSVLLCLLIVSAMDVGAYFCGRRWGRSKLAPAVSPGKTWEGLWGGLAFSALTALCFGHLFGVSDKSWQLLALAVPTALTSVVGDLMESMVKRERGVKDSGTLLPGHGGVLDRLDGVLSALPIYALVLIIIN